MITLQDSHSFGNLTGITEDAETTEHSSIDESTTDYDSAPFSPMLSEHDHNIGSTGLRRIRQQPTSRAPSQPPSPIAPFSPPARRSSSTTMSSPSGQAALLGANVSPDTNMGEDLSRFPSESLHSFSFTHQPEDILHSRQNLLKRSIDFMREKLGWTSSHPGLVTAEAKVSGDTEIQSMIELLTRANALGDDMHRVQRSRILNGPLTGPADVQLNIFDRSFVQRSQSLHQLKNEQTKHDTEVGEEKNFLEPDPVSEPFSSADTPDPGFVESYSSARSSSANRSSKLSQTQTGLKRTETDLSLATLQNKLVEILGRPYVAKESPCDAPLLSPTLSAFGKSFNTSANVPSAVHGHANRWSPTAQAIFTTEAQSPWTILAANDLACLVFGVTKAEVKRLGILEVVREDRRAWLEEKLGSSREKNSTPSSPTTNSYSQNSPTPPTSSFISRGGVTAQLLSKPSSRQIASQKAQNEKVNDGGLLRNNITKDRPHHNATKSRGVLLCGDIVPVQKRDGSTGSASLWVKEKRGGLIWVLEEIVEDMVTLHLDFEGRILSSDGPKEAIWGDNHVLPRSDVRQLLPKLPTLASSSGINIDFECISKTQYYTAQNSEGINIPTSVTVDALTRALHVSSFPHIAGIMVLSAHTLQIMSANSVFSAALFGYSNPDGLKINQIIPQFDKLLDILLEEGEEAILTDGIVISEHSFRQARAHLAMREGSNDAAAMFSRPPGLTARHRDGSEINVDLQMRIVRSDRQKPVTDGSPTKQIEDWPDTKPPKESSSEHSEIVYALWVTYLRQIHSMNQPHGSASPVEVRPTTPRQPSPGQRNQPGISLTKDISVQKTPSVSSLSQQIQEAASQPISDVSPKILSIDTRSGVPKVIPKEPARKKRITDFVTIEDMGQGAYGQVKLAKYAKTGGRIVVLKYVTKKRILVDTWTRDRRLGTVPLEIHVLDYLRKDHLKHPNIIEMTDFFEDDINYYIEMIPHGLPGMDLFDYIEMKPTIDEAECRSIFLQVVAALHHLHTKALVVHRDIKDENIILDSENRVKLIDFGSAAYIKNGPFDVFVGTIDYAAPEVLQGKSYRGKEQDVWALGILLYTLIYKENPFYSIDEIMDRELRIPWVLSEPSINLIKAMLNREVEHRLTITQVIEHPWCVNEGKAAS